MTFLRAAYCQFSRGAIFCLAVQLGGAYTNRYLPREINAGKTVRAPAVGRKDVILSSFLGCR